MTIKSINEPNALSHISLMPQSINEPRPLPEGPPTIEGLNPSEAVAGADQLLVVHGANFIPECVIVFDGTALPTNFERADKISATLPASAPGEYPVTVALGPLQTAAETFTFTEAEPLPETEGADPDELEDELEQAEEEGDFKPTHRGKPTTSIRRKGRR